MTARRRSLALGLAVSLILVATFLAVPLLLSPEAVKAFFLHQLEGQIGRTIEVGEVRFALLPSIKLSLDDVAIRDVDPSQSPFRAKHIDVVLRAWPLLRLQVVGKRLLIEQPRIEVRRDLSGRWNLSAAPQGGAAEADLGQAMAVLLAIRETRVKGGEILIVDEFRPDGSRRAKLTALDLTLAARPQEQSVDLDLSATVPSPRGGTILLLTGRLSRPGPSAGMQAALGGTPLAAGLTFEGSAEAAEVDLRQLADFFGPRPVPDRIAGAASVRGRIRLAPGVAGYDLVLSDMRGEVDHLALAGQASLSGLLTPQPTFSLTFASSPVNLADLLARFPLQWLNPRIQDIVVERQVQGLVEVVTATLSGTTGPEPRISLTGQFRIRQGRALLGTEGVLAHDLEATVFVEPDRIRVVDLTGAYSALHVRGGSAIIFLQESGPWIEMDITGDMGAPELVAVLRRTLDPSLFTRALAELRDIAGTTVLTFRLAGHLTDPAGLKFLGGDFVVRDVGFRAPALPERLEGLNGRVRVAQERIELDRLFAFIGRSRVQVEGAIETAGRPTLRNFLALATVDARDLVGLLPKETASSLGLEGVIGARLALTGDPAAPQMQAVLDLKEAALTAPVMRKPAGTPATLEFEGSLSPTQVVTAKRLELSVPPFRVAGSGRLTLGAKPAVDASFVTTPIVLAQLPAGMRVASLDAGTLEVSLDVKGWGRDWRRWLLGGWIALTDGQITVKELDAPIRNLFVRVKLVRNRAEIKQLSFRIGESDVRATGVVQDWTGKPVIDLKADSAKLDIELLIPKGERSPIRDAVEELAATGRLVGTLTIAEGVYKQMPFHEVSCRINVANGVLDVDRITAASEGGRIAGRLVVTLPRRKPAEGEVVFRVSQVPFKRILQMLGDEKRRVEGTLWTSGTLRMHGRHPRGVLHTLEGEVHFDVKNGHIYRGTVIPKIIGILNLPALLQGKVDLAKEGFPFDRVSGALTIAGGQIHSENLVIDSPIMKMSAAGNYDLPADRLDVVVVVSPLGSYAKFLKSIPLFGRLLKGDRKGVVTATFEVTGPLQDPDVNYKPIESLTTGVKGLAELAFDVLKNTILLPKDLLSGEAESPAAPQEDHAPERPAAGSP
ncbi:YhdP family protein [Nitrospira sp. Kam-Ns4a]